MNSLPTKLLSCLLVIFIGFTANAQSKFYVSKSGSDLNPGTKSKPFKTLEKARNAVRKINGKMKKDITVYLRGGSYFRDKTFQLTDKDSGTNGKKVIYTAYPKEKVLISGGTPVKGWKKHQGQIYKATLSGKNVNSDNNFRELYVNGKRAYRARSPKLIRAGWYNQAGKPAGYTISKNDMKLFKNGGDVELVWSMNWRQHRMLVDKIEDSGQGHYNVIMKQPFLHQALIEDYGRARPTPNNPFFIENAYELLDEPGEWYYDRPSKTLYYWPKEGQNMKTARVIVPRTQTLISLKGASKRKKVENIQFSKLSFQHTTWEKAYKEGVTAIQANHYNIQPPIVEGPNNGTGSHTDNAELPRGAIELEYTKNISLIGNKLSNTGGTGIILFNSVLDTQIRKNSIKDISETAIIIGSWVHNFIDKDEEELCKNILIRNNVIDNIGLQYWGAPGIQMYYADGMTIEHNEISNTVYGGIQIGWNGWQGTEKDSTSNRNTIIRYNRIENYSRKTGDTGAIYSLGQHPNSEFYGNHFKNAGKYLAAQYNDEGSAFMYWHDNVVEQNQKVDGDFLLFSAWRATIHDNWLDHIYTNIEPINNKGIRCYLTNIKVEKNGWSSKAKAIIDGAGLTKKAYKAPRNPAKGDIAYGKNAVMYKKNGGEDFGAIGHLAQFAVDGNPKTSAMAKDVQDFALEVDLLNIYSINQIKLNFADGKESNNFKVYASRDGVNWQTLGQTKNLTFKKMNARFVKVESANSSSKMAIANIEVFGKRAKKAKLSKPVAFSAPSKKNLQLWVKADEGVKTGGEDFVAKWKDHSGKGNHLVLPKAFTRLDPASSGTTVSTKKPVLWRALKNGRPAVRFDGFDDCLVANGVAGDFKNNTIFILFRPHTVHNHNQVFQAKGGSGEFVFHAANGGTVHAGSDGKASFKQNAVLKAGQWQVMTYTQSNGKAKLFSGSKLLESKSMPVSKPWTGFMFGTNVDFRRKGGHTIDGDVAEVLVYNKALSSSEIKTIQAYLNTKYKLSSTK